MSEKLTYDEARHAIQTGVQYEIETGLRAHDPKLLRTGINMAMCDHAALARLLIQKGVITHEEYVEAITAEANREVERYEERANRGRIGWRIRFR